MTIRRTTLAQAAKDAGDVSQESCSWWDAWRDGAKDLTLGIKLLPPGFLLRTKDRRRAAPPNLQSKLQLTN